MLDIIPTGDTWQRADYGFALIYWRWAFLAETARFPERAIGATGAEAFFFESILGRWLDIFDAAAYTHYAESLQSPENVRVICENYRAGARSIASLTSSKRGRARSSVAFRY